MKKIAQGIVGVAAGIVSTGSVYAAEGNTWTGAYVSAGFGASTVNSDEKSYGGSYDYDNEAYFSGVQDKSKATASVGFGYDKQVNDKIVVGVFADVNLVGLNTSNTGSWDNGNYTYSTSTNVKDAISLGIKMGALLTDNDLLYVSGGVTQAKIKVNMTETDDYDYTYIASGSKKKSGGFVGLGLEHKFGENVSVVADYRYTDYGKVSAGEPIYPDGSNVGNGPFMTHESDVTTHNLSLNLKYKF